MIFLKHCDFEFTFISMNDFLVLVKLNISKIKILPNKKKTSIT